MVSGFSPFCRGKYQHPQFFCWPGAFARSGPTEIAKLFLRNQMLFSDRSDDDGIFVGAIPGRDEAAAHETINDFPAPSYSTI